jgi:V8-like Glu-specific endopeptidase
MDNRWKYPRTGHRGQGRYVLGWLTRRNGRITVTAVLTVLAVLLITPANGAAIDVVAKISHAVRRLVGPTHNGLAVSEVGRSFTGTAAVGALFITSDGKLTRHFCTASVVNSPGGDLVVTAAHCVSEALLSTVVFVPDYSDGKSPYGIWPVKNAYTDRAWQSSSDPDDDVAFLQLSPSKDGVPVEDVTGAEQIGTGWPSRQEVQVIGYPDGENQPVWCENWTTSFSPTQLQFNCNGYTNGTSGGPFLADVDSVTGEGTIVGVIGGYEQGGLTSSVSYAAVFGPNVAALYAAAVAGS